MPFDNRQGKRMINKLQFPMILLVLLMIIFALYSIFLAVHLQVGIIPDEVAHFKFSMYFASTLGIPRDAQQTLETGWYITHNPVLYFWINGRVINLFALFLPSATSRQVLVLLRLTSVVYSLVTVFFCYKLSKEIISNVWLQLLPAFLLTNTLMFVFLSGGVSYDNLTNMLCMMGFLFEVRAFSGKNFFTNSTAWMICIGLGTLVKYTVVPLALFMGIAWVIYLFLHRKVIRKEKIRKNCLIPLSLVLVLLFAVNIGIYGVNLVKYHSLIPDCSALFTQEQCELSPFVQRYHEIALDHKLTIVESVQLGYPNPLEYVLDSWIPNMLYRIFGILGHLSYFPSHIIIFFRLLLLWILLLAFRYIDRPSFILISLVCIFILYAFVLLYMNYNSELTYGFKQIAMQGRYIFPVIGPIYVFISYVFIKVNNRALRLATIFLSIALFFLGGPIKFILDYNSIFHGWFI